MSILSGYTRYKRHILTSKGYKLCSQWTSSNSVVMGDGTDDTNTLETNLGSIKGITDSLTATSSNIALSASAGNNLQTQVDTLNSNFNNCVKFSGGENAVMQRYYLNCGSVAPRSLSQKIITFGKEMPSANYIVSLTMIGTPAYWSNIAISASDKSKTGFVINLFNNGDYTVDNVYIDWIVLSY